MPDALACIRFGVDDVTRSDALQDARVLLRHRFRPDVADAGVQQVSGGDHRRLDAVSDGDDGGVEIRRVELLDGEHVGHVGLNGGNLRDHLLTSSGSLSTASTSCPMESNVVATELPNRPSPTTRMLLLLRAMPSSFPPPCAAMPVPPSWTPPILRAAVNGTASTS